MQAREKEIFFEENYDRIRFLAFTCFPFVDFIEDMTHDIYITFMDKSEIEDTQEAAMNELRNIAKNASKKYWRQKYQSRFDVLQRIGLKMNEIAETRYGHSNPEEEVESLRLCLDLLPERDKDLIEWFYFRKMSCVEISKKTNINVDAIYQRISRIRRKLAECMRKKQENDLLTR